MIKGYLLDTNVISELARPKPDAVVLSWLEQVDESLLYTSCLVVGELEKGIALVEDGVKQRKLTEQLQVIEASFGARVISLDRETAKIWGKLTAHEQRAGKTPPIIGAFIASQCLSHNLVLVTRNLKDFVQFDGLQVLSPCKRENSMMY